MLYLALSSHIALLCSFASGVAHDGPQPVPNPRNYSDQCLSSFAFSSISRLSLLSCMAHPLRKES